MSVLLHSTDMLFRIICNMGMVRLDNMPQRVKRWIPALWFGWLSQNLPCRNPRSLSSTSQSRKKVLMLISVIRGRIRTVFLFVSGSLRITILANGCDTHIVMVLQDMSHQTASRLGLQVQCSQNAGIARRGRSAPCQNIFWRIWQCFPSNASSPTPHRSLSTCAGNQKLSKSWHCQDRLDPHPLILPSRYGTILYYIIVLSTVYFYQKKYSILPSHVFCKYVCCHIW